jgi:hypothetical protein
MDDDGHAVSYNVLARGTPVVASDGAQIGTVREVLDNEREHIFDGLVVDTPAGPRWVDAPEVARIAERRVTLTLTADEAAALPEEDHARGVEYGADVRGGRLSRLFGGPWKRRR